MIRYDPGMRLPAAPDLNALPGTALFSRLRALGLGSARLREMTTGPDTLWRPLDPTRETLYSDAADRIAARLLFCGQNVSRDEAAEALGKSVLEACLRAGLLTAEVSCRLHLRPVGPLYLFSDFLECGPYAVMGAGETTAVLYVAAKPPRRTGAVLDLGCGAGTLALLLAADADRVTGTDISERAVCFARVNAVLNGVGNAEFAAGDLYEPVAGRTFDLIVCQPPYYPDEAGGTATFLHGGVRGDEIACRVVAGMRDHLTERGRGLVFASWHDGTIPPLPEGLGALELYTRRREISHTRQSISVLYRGSGWRAVEVPPERWGDADAALIEALL